MQPPTQDSPRYRFGAFEVCLETGELLKHQRRIRLQRKPFEVLAALLEHSGRLVTRDNLRQRLWPADTFVDFDNGLNTALSKLREALGDTAEKPRYIETFERRGYRFMAQVEKLTDVLASPLGELAVERKCLEPHSTLVEFRGKLMYGPECRQVERLTTQLVDEGERKIVFDLSPVTYLDSTGIGILVMCSGKIKDAGGELRIAGARGHVLTVLKMTKVDKIMALDSTTAEALQRLTGSAA